MRLPLPEMMQKTMPHQQLQLLQLQKLQQQLLLLLTVAVHPCWAPPAVVSILPDLLQSLSCREWLLLVLLQAFPLVCERAWLPVVPALPVVRLGVVVA